MIIACPLLVVNCSPVVPSTVWVFYYNDKQTKNTQVLIQAREQRGITQYRLAALMKRDRRWLNLLEHGRREPRATTIIDIAKALDMDPGDLIRHLALLLEESASEPQLPE